MGTNSAVANALHSGGKRHNKIEATAETSFEHPPMAKLISREQAIEVAKQLVEKYEKLDDDDRINVADATTDILSPRIFLTLKWTRTIRLTRQHQRISPRRIPHALEVAASKQAWIPDLRVTVAENAGITPMTQTPAGEENTADDAGENGIMPTQRSKTMSRTTQSKKKVTLLTKIQTRRSSTQPSPRAMKRTGLTRMFGQHLTRTPTHHL